MDDAVAGAAVCGERAASERSRTAPLRADVRRLHHAARITTTTASGSTDRRALAIALVLILAFMVVEVVGGLVAGSLALLADAGHMLTDAGEPRASRSSRPGSRARPAQRRRSFGYRRAEILAALANGVTLLASRC